MMRFLLTKLLPIGATIGIFNSALSPVKPALAMFAAAANALAGETNQAVDTSALDQAGQGHRPSAPQKGLAPGGKRKTLEGFADALDPEVPKDDADAFGWKAGDRAAKPLAAPKPPGKK